MTWNYRLVKKHTKNPEKLGGNEYFTYAIHEAFYDEDGKVWGITENSINLSAEHLNELMISWDMMIEAFGQPVLNYDEIGKDGAKGPDCLSEEELKDTVPFDEVCEELDLEPFDSEAYHREETEANAKEELRHQAEFVGRSPEHIHSLIKTLRSQSP